MSIFITGTDQALAQPISATVSRLDQRMSVRHAGSLDVSVEIFQKDSILQDAG